MTDWLAWHVYQHEYQSELLVGAVLPLVDSLRADRLVDAAFFLRYWEGGPHVRLRIAPAVDADTTAVSGRVRAALTAWCGTHPSPHPMSPEAYSALQSRLSPGAGEPRLVADGTVLDAVYQPEHDRYGWGAALAASERHFAMSSGLALKFLRGRPAARDRETLALVVLADVFGRCPASLRGGVIEQMQDHADRLEAPAPTVHAAAVRRALAAPPEALRALSASLDELAIVLSDPDITFHPPPEAFGGIRPGTPHVWTTLDLCAHLFCNRIGVSMPTELLLRSGLAQASRQLGYVSPEAVS